MAQLPKELTCSHRFQGRAAPVCIVLAALTVTAMAIPISTASAATAAAGSVNFMRTAEGTFDTFTSAPTTAQKDWMKAHYWRMRAYAPYFDTRLSWSSKAWFYQSAYADLSRQRRRHPAPRMDPARRRRQQALHPVRLLRRQVLAVRRRHRQPRLPEVVARPGPPAARQGLRRRLHRRCQPVSQGLQRPRAGGRSDRPADGRRDERADVAALPRRSHAGRPRRVPDGRDRPQRDLVRRRHDRRPAARPQGRQPDQPRARRQRRRPHGRHRQVELPEADGLRRPSPGRGTRGRLRRHLDHRRRPPLRARRVLPGLLGP